MLAVRAGLGLEWTSEYTILKKRSNHSPTLPDDDDDDDEIH